MKKKQTLSLWDIIILFLCIYVLVALFVVSVFPVSESTRYAINITDFFVCLLFIGDFIYRVVKADNKLQYLKWGWIDLLSSIPTIPFFRLGRILRVVRILRIIKGAKTLKTIIHVIFIKRARSTFLGVVLASLALLLFSTLAIINFEATLSSDEAFWWSLFTLITGEHGSFYPQTIEGKIISALLMTAGVTLFGTFTATVATIFLESEQKEDEARDNHILKEINDLKIQISKIDNKITELINKE